MFEDLLSIDQMKLLAGDLAFLDDRNPRATASLFLASESSVPLT